MEQVMANILIIDDEEYVRDVLSARVLQLKHHPEFALTFNQALEMINSKPFDIVFVDINLPDGNGLDLLPIIRRNQLQPEIIIITGFSSDEGAEIAIKNGVWDYITKPLIKDDILLRIKRTLEYHRVKNSNSTLNLIDAQDIIGNSCGIKKCLEEVAQCADSSANVLIYGETGTGKELFAKLIHNNNKDRRDKNFVVVDCAAIPEPLAESELFGYVKGAFTGSEKAFEGLILKADKGTLFLDEIGELPFSIQSTFLRVLEDKTFRHLGSSTEKKSDFRLISATNKNLESMVNEGTFRNDLFHRINTITIELPPLRERKTDIKAIAEYHIKQLCIRHKLEQKKLHPETLEFLKFYGWTGNIRELIHTLERAILFEKSSSTIYPFFLPDNIRLCFFKQNLKQNINPQDVVQKHLASPAYFNPPSIASNTSIPFNKNQVASNDNILSLKEYRNSIIENLESNYLAQLLEQTGWDIEKVAEISDLSANRIYVLIKKYNLKRT